jgi:uncharacterized tellurite resistance protein B-like protein
LLKSIQDLVKNLIDGTDEQPVDRERALRIATAALLSEVAKADYEEQVEESELIFNLLRERFGLSAEDAELLQGEGYREAEESVSLQAFTRLLHEALPAADKLELVTMLWQVAFADQRLDRYEDHLVRKIADLLYVSHKDQIRLRNIVREP